MVGGSESKFECVESFSHTSCRGNAYRLSLIHAQPCSGNNSVIEMLDSQETKKLAIYKYDFSSKGIILKAVFYKGNEKCYTTGFSGGSRPSDKGERVGGGGSKNKGEPPGPLPLIRHWGFFITGFGIVRDSLSTVFKELTVNLFACVSSYCHSCGNNEVNFLNLVFLFSNALTI